jgi:hypothetical protein
VPDNQARAELVVRLFRGPYADILHVPGEVQVEQEIYASENRRWGQAFEPLFSSAIQNPDEPDAYSILLLKIHSIMIEVRLTGYLSGSELVYDRFCKGEYA